MRRARAAATTRRTRWTLALAATLATLAALVLLAPANSQTANAQTENAQTAPDDPESRIVGGTAVPNGKYPFVTALLFKGPGSAYDRQFCGGTLVAPNKVLTAAHCVSGAGAQDLQTATGRTVLDSGQGQMRNVTRIDVHPRYQASTFRYDAAVLTLRRPVDNIRPVKLASSSQNNLEQPGRSATIVGWGSTEKQSASGSAAQNFPNRMREARVPLVSDAQASRSYSNYAPALMVAAGKEGKDACQGDSGGPIFSRTPSGPIQIGITSYGIGCAAQGYPGVYAEVNNSGISSFIDSRIGATGGTANVEQDASQTAEQTAA